MSSSYGREPVSHHARLVSQNPGYLSLIRCCGHRIQDFQQKVAALSLMKGIYDDRGLASTSQCEIDAMLENARSRTALKTLLEEKLKVMQDLHIQLSGPHGARVAAELIKRRRP